MRYNYQMKYILALVVVCVLGAGWFWWEGRPASDSESAKPTMVTPETEDRIIVPESLIDPELMRHIESKSRLILLKTPNVNTEVTSPLLVSGLARGQWYFEGSFPIVMTDWDGKIIAEGVATAQGDWMTEQYVPFTATIDFVSPYHEDDPSFMQRGSLILRKDNPSGLPEHDDALEIPILFSLSSPDVVQ